MTMVTNHLLTGMILQVTSTLGMLQKPSNNDK